MKKSLALVLVAVAALAGCATAMEPNLAPTPTLGFDLVDPASVKATAYALDYEACSKLANQDDLDIRRAAAGALGAVTGKATLGLFGGGSSKNADRVSVLKACLTGRGYKVLR